MASPLPISTPAAPAPNAAALAAAGEPAPPPESAPRKGGRPLGSKNKAKRSHHSKSPPRAVRYGDMTKAEYETSKADLARELRAARAQLASSSSALPSPPPAFAVVHDGPPPPARVDPREGNAERLGALAGSIIGAIFEGLVAWRGPTWELSDTRANQLGDLWGEYFSYVLPETMTPKDLALLTAAGGTAVLVGVKLKAERDAKKPANGAAPPAAPKPAAELRWGPSLT